MGTMADRSPAKNKYSWDSWVLGSMMYLEKDVPPLCFAFFKLNQGFGRKLGRLSQTPIKTHGSDPGDEAV